MLWPLLLEGKLVSFTLIYERVHVVRTPSENSDCGQIVIIAADKVSDGGNLNKSGGQEE